MLKISLYGRGDLDPEAVRIHGAAGMVEGQWRQSHRVSTV